MKDLFSYLPLFFMPLDLMAGMLINSSVFLSNEDIAAVYCAANIFPDKERLISYKVNIVEEGSRIYIYFFESPINDNTNYMGGVSCEYNTNKKLSP